MEITVKKKACDFCENDNINGTCEICKKDFCYEHAENDDWSFPNYRLCRYCNDIVWEKFEEMIKQLKTERREE